MPLGMDSTIVYASKPAGKWHYDGKVYQSDIDRNSPYNTRKIIGLPIGPVGCPGLLSLKAALEPAKQTLFIMCVTRQTIADRIISTAPNKNFSRA